MDMNRKAANPHYTAFLGNGAEQIGVLTKRPETLIMSWWQYVYTEGVRSSSLLPPKAFQR